jgi:hypothetical protein
MLLRDQENVNMVLTESPFAGFVLPGTTHDWRFLLAHGDKIPRYFSIPWYGIERAAQRWSSLTKIPWDTIFLGHHHQYAEIEGTKFINGTWVGATDLSVGSMRAANRPTQWVLFHHPEVGWTSRWPVYMAPEPRLGGEPDEMGMLTPYQTIGEAGVKRHYPGRKK